MEDYVIKYQAKLIEVKGNIEKIKKIKLDVSQAEIMLQEIEHKTEKNLEEYLETTKGRIRNYFANDLLLKIYSEAIESLENLNFKLLEEYQEYHTIYVEICEIKKLLKEANLKEREKLIDRMIELKKMLKHSSTLPYQMKEQLVNQVYELVYEGIKIECFFRHDFKLLNEVREDEVDRVFVSMLVKRDLEKYNNSTSSKITVVEDLESKSLLDVELIDRITNEELKKDYCLKNYGQLSQLETCLKEAKKKDIFLSEREEEINQKNKKIKELKNYRKKFQKERMKRRMILVTNLFFYGGAMASGPYVIQDTVYETTIVTYDSTKEEPERRTEFLYKQADSVTLTEYTPWQEPNSYRSEYVRDIYSYDLSKVTYSSVEDLWNGDFQGELTYTVKPESSPEKKEFMTEHKMVLEIVTQNRKIKDKVPLKHPDVRFYSFWLMLSACELVLLLLMSQKSKNIKSEIQYYNEKIEELEALRDEWNKDFEQGYKELQTTLEKLIKECESLPKSIQQYGELSELILDLKKQK